MFGIPKLDGFWKLGQCKSNNKIRWMSLGHIHSVNELHVSGVYYTLKLFHNIMDFVL